MDDLRSTHHGFRGASSSSAHAAASTAAGVSELRRSTDQTRGLMVTMGSSAVDDSDDLNEYGHGHGHGYNHTHEADTGHGPSASGTPAAASKKAIKGMIRRASVSLHGFIQRRASFAGSRATASGPDDAPAATAAPASMSSHFLPSRLLRSPTHAHSLSHSNILSSPSASQANGRLMVPARSPAVGAGADAHAQPRPTTSHNFPTWRRVRQVASFRHSRVFDPDTHAGGAGAPAAGSASGSGSSAYYDGSGPFLPTGSNSMDCPNREAAAAYGHYAGASLSSSAPLPSGLSALGSGGTPAGLGPRPPVIPPNTGGAARAAAAAAFQTDMYQHLQPKRPRQDEFGNDRESGIGIAITSSESDSADDASMPDAYNCSNLDCTSADASQLHITKVDFVANLPTELAIMILAELDAAGLAAASRVSCAWRQAVRNQHIWRESFLREKTATYATSGPVRPGVGLGVPPIRPTCDWRQVYRVKHELDRRWQEGKTRPVYLNGHSDSIYCLQFDERKIITGSRDKTIRIWDMQTLACRLVIGPPDVVRDSHLLFDDNGQPVHYITTAYHTRSADSVPAAVSFPMHHSASILCLQYDDRILVTGSSDSSCIVYSVQSGYRPIRRLLHHSAAVLDLCFDDRHIVTCSKDVTICVWDRETGAMLKQLRGHSGPVNAVQMRGNTIVSCSGDFRVKLWNIETGKAIREFTGHTKGLACSQFSEDGRFVASAGNDRVIRIWDANTGECVREMRAHESLVRSLHIDSVSGRLVSASYDRDIKVFDMETGQQLLDFPQWHHSWVLSAKSDYRRIISTGQDPKILVMDFGAGIDGIELLETATDADACIGDLGPLARALSSNTGATVIEPPPEQAPPVI